MAMKQIRKGLAVGLAALLIMMIPMQAQAAPVEQNETSIRARYVQMALRELGYFSNYGITGYYGDATVAAVAAFQTDKNVTVTGIADEATMALLLASVPLETIKPVDPEKMGAIDWFDTVQYVFPRECDAMVTDVDTGKVFWVRRTFGRNHADIEPLTAEDAAIIKEVWGGEWSWVRRAVVVEVGEYILAGSMTAFPHAGRDDAPAVAMCNNLSGGYGYGQNLDSVKGNGVDGHMDIHFLNSLTHGSNEKQKVHQDAVAKAAAYIETQKADFTFFSMLFDR